MDGNGSSGKKEKMKYNCPICNYNFVDDNPIRLSVTNLYYCNNCGVVFAKPNFHNPDKDFFDSYQVNQWLKYYRLFRKRSHRLFVEKHKELFKNGMSILDIGCAAGWFLDEVKIKFKTAVTVGVEPSPSMKGKINKSHRVYQLRAKQLGQVKGMFDMVTLWNVFEHFSNPHEIIRLVLNKLKKNGYLVLSVPNQKGLISGISYFLTRISRGIFSMPLEELFQTDNAFGHLFHYDRSSLSELLEKNGFAVLWFEGADIVDVSNVRQRLKVSANHGDEIKQQVLAAIVARLTRIAGIIGFQDEMVVASRKI